MLESKLGASCESRSACMGKGLCQEGIVSLNIWQMNNISEVNGSIHKLTHFGNLGAVSSLAGLQKQSFHLLQLNEVTIISLVLEGQNSE